MLSLIKNKISKEYIYAKKHTVNVYPLEDVILKFKKSENKIEKIIEFYIEKMDFEKLKFVIKMIASSDKKTSLSINQVKDYVIQLITEAVENFIQTSMDSIYISEYIVVGVTSYQGKHQLFVCPRYDFTKIR